MSNELESLWENLLSREPELVRGAFTDLDQEEKEAVLAHLKRMVNEEGWHIEQQISAKSALNVLGEIPPRDGISGSPN